MSLPQAVLFDFDGTLVHITIDFQAMRQGAVDVIHRYGETAEGGSRFTLELVESVRDRLAARDEAIAAAFQRDALASIREVELMAARDARPLPGVPETLAWLRARGIRLGIVTRNCRPAVLEVAVRHGLPFDVLLSRDDVRHVKPNPEHLLEGLRLLGASPGCSIMVGDHPTDIQAAQAAGMVSVGLTTTRAAEAFDVTPDFMIDRMDSLIGLVNNGSWRVVAESRSKRDG
ncbi:MAG: HAD-IA family hydrolase [Anaerolineae bacterium]|nr:HAD-IA family hydrolase [Anaerolineae bacterium]